MACWWAEKACSKSSCSGPTSQQLLGVELMLKSQVGRSTTLAIALPAAQRLMAVSPEPRPKEVSIASGAFSCSTTSRPARCDAHLA
jgi:hypothetical protein